MYEPCLNVRHRKYIIVVPMLDECRRLTFLCFLLYKKPYTLTVRPSNHISVNHICLWCPPFKKTAAFTSCYCTRIQHQILLYNHVRLPFAVCSTLSTKIFILLCNASLTQVSINSKCVLLTVTLTYEQLKWKLSTAAYQNKMLSSSHTNIYSTYASQFQSGIVIVVSCKWDLEWWLIDDDIPFEFISIAIWEYVIVFVLCKIMKHSLGFPPWHF